VKKNCMVVAVLLLTAVPALAQTTPAWRRSPTRLLFDASIGDASGLGYKVPDLVFGLALERPIGSRFEVQANLDYSPDRKYITNDGRSFLAGARGVVWLSHRIAITGGMNYSALWTSRFDKSAHYPVAGVLLRDSWLGLPGRMYVTYLFPTGCVLASPSNPCRIQSNRLKGVEFNQEFRLWPHLRAGVQMGFYHFCDQGNPLAAYAPRACHMTGTTAVRFRFEFPKGNDAAY
jgi:hypothetical protein